MCCYGCPILQMRKPDTKGRNNYLKPHSEALAELSIDAWSVRGTHNLTGTPFSLKAHFHPCLS